MHHLVLFYIITVVATDQVRCLQIKDLSREFWILENDDHNISLPIVTIPGSVHTTLMNNDVIGDPYIGYRDSQYAWIADNDWIFKTKFKVPPNLLRAKTIVLKLDVVDTVADIILNDQIIGHVQNMFVQVLINVDKYLHENNELIVYFYSPTKYVDEKYENYMTQVGYKVPPVELPGVQHGRNHQNFIRKEQCSFSWDWGPSFPTIGISGDVFLEFTDIAVVNNVLVHTILSKEQSIWQVILDAVIYTTVETEADILYGFDGYQQEMNVTLSCGVQKITLKKINVPMHRVQMWWPRGHGSQTLYNAYVKVIDRSTLESSSKHVRFGFRIVELIQKTLNEGLSFYFEINEKPIFLKGSNWIPADSFQERVTSTLLEQLLNATVDANMNALRVWGGGVYEQNRFYDLANELGIVIWQDLMFAVALYPVNQEFLQSVSDEVKWQVQRLQHNPSIIAWSGNNENEAAIAQQWWNEVKTNKKRLISDYKELYVNTIKPIIEEEDWNRPFIVSSPSNGKQSEDEGYISKNPQNELYGDVHYYNYEADCWNVSTFPKPRFVSEYGYQSYPSYITLSHIANQSEMTWNSSLMFYRQHHANGNEEIEHFIRQHYKFPTTSSSSNEYFDHMIYLSQIVQATCIKYESEHYRRLQGNFVGSAGNTMGALYWQLNDIWQAPSWSSIEYGGRWKMLHYYVKKFFGASVISGFVDMSMVTAYVLFDQPDKTPVMRVNISVYGWESFNVEWNKDIRVMEYKEAGFVFKESIDTLCPSRKCFVNLELYEDNLLTTHSTSNVFLASFKEIQLYNPQLKIKNILTETDFKFQIYIQAHLPAAFVWLETKLDGHFSDNGFIMHFSDIKIAFESVLPITEKMLHASLNIKSLYDVYIT